MRDIVISAKNEFLFKDKSYDEITIKSIISKEVELFIIEENILVKVFEGIKVAKEKNISEIIRAEYGDENNILMHYEHDKKRKKLYLYSIGNGRKVKCLSENLKELKVNPIQFYIKNFVSRKVKKFNEYIIIVNIREIVYCLDIINNFIIKSIVESKVNFIKSYNFDEIKEGKTIVISSKDKDIIPKEIQCKYNMFILEIGEIINEKIFKI